MGGISVKRPRLFALSLALATAASVSLTMPSPVRADTAGALKNVATQMCIEPDSPFQGATIELVACATQVRDTLQEWDYKCFDQACSQFHVVNHGSGLCLSTRNGATNGTNLELWTCNNISNEKWDYGPNPNGEPFELRSRVSGTTTHCLDVPNGLPIAGQWMQLYDCNGTAAQLFTSGPGIIE
jgi:Ricin-type beta-trefoil lectin domain